MPIPDIVLRSRPTQRERTFQRGDTFLWQFRFLDPATGEPVIMTDVEARLTVREKHDSPSALLEIGPVNPDVDGWFILSKPWDEMDLDPLVDASVSGLTTQLGWYDVELRTTSGTAQRKTLLFGNATLQLELTK